RRPIFAKRSRFGVGTCPPNVPHCPNPASSIRMIKTFGAPAGALARAIVPGLESLKVRPIFASLKASSGLGKTTCAAWLCKQDVEAVKMQTSTVLSNCCLVFMFGFLSLPLFELDGYLFDRARELERRRVRGVDR